MIAIHKQQMNLVETEGEREKKTCCFIRFNQAVIYLPEKS